MFQAHYRPYLTYNLHKTPVIILMYQMRKLRPMITEPSASKAHAMQQICLPYTLYSGVEN